MNVVALIGNLATDVDLRETTTGKKVASFRLAVGRGGEGADFVGVTVWERQAETCAEHLAKGSRVALEGRLQSRTWESPEGGRRSAVEVVAHRVEFLGSKPDRGEVVPFERAAVVS